MFIKYSTEQRLLAFMEEGKMFFNPAQKFREIEEKQLIKGQGDRYDSGLHSMANTVVTKLPDGRKAVAHDIEVSLLMSPARYTPIFCLKRSKNEYITKKYYYELKSQFPDYTHAIIIDDEKEFLENIRFSMTSKAFAHKVFYQDNYFLDFIDFMYSGISDIRFYPIKKKRHSYYAHILVENNSGKIERDFWIDSSNYFKTMFRKDIFFQNQNEYRIVLPHERIKEGRSFQIKPFRAQIAAIDRLIKEKV